MLVSQTFILISTLVSLKSRNFVPNSEQTEIKEIYPLEVIFRTAALELKTTECSLARAYIIKV